MGMFPASVCFISGFKYRQIVSDLKKKKRARLWLAGIRSEKEIIKSSEWLSLFKTLEVGKNKTDVKLYYIIIKDFRFTDMCYVRLAHEVTHICQFFLPRVLNRDEEHEAEAYLHSYIMERCLNSLRGKP